MNIFDKTERVIECVAKYDTSPYKGDYELLEIGKKYTVTEIDMYGWHTMIGLKEFPGKRFNSVLFEESEEQHMERMEMTANSTKEEFENLDYFEPTGEFNGIIIIPTNEMHESGYKCMKFALMDHWEVVGCVGGGSDVIHLNGIGGYGKDFNRSFGTGLMKRVDWSIDCLPNGLIRLFCSHKLELDDIICSDFNLYVKEDK